MDFSEAHKCTGPDPVFSPNGRYVATAVDFRLVIRDVESLQILQLYSCLDKVEEVIWSCDSAYLLCGLYKRGIVQVWSVDDHTWTCKIDEGPAGVAHARWAPSGRRDGFSSVRKPGRPAVESHPARRHVITVADFKLRLSVWSLVDRSCVQYPSPKVTEAGKGIAFTEDGRFMALAEVRTCGT